MNRLKNILKLDAEIAELITQKTSNCKMYAKENGKFSKEDIVSKLENSKEKYQILDLIYDSSLNRIRYKITKLHPNLNIIDKRVFEWISEDKLV